VANVVYIFGINSEIKYIVTCINHPLEAEIGPISSKYQNYLPHNIAPWGEISPPLKTTVRYDFTKMS